MAEKRAKTDKNDTEMDTEGTVVVSTSQSQSGHKKETNIYLMDLDEEAIVDFMKDQLYDKTNHHFKDKTRKECL